MKSFKRNWEGFVSFFVGIGKYLHIRINKNAALLWDEENPQKMKYGDLYKPGEEKKTEEEQKK